MPTMRVYTTEEGATAGVPELRRSRQPVPKWMRVAAIVVGTAIGGAVGSTTSGAVIASRLGLVTQKVHDDDRKADHDQQVARDAVIDGKFTALDKRLDEMTKAQQAQAQATQALTRIIRKIKPAAAMATAKDTP